MQSDAKIAVAKNFTTLIFEKRPWSDAGGLFQEEYKTLFLPEIALYFDICEPGVFKKRRAFCAQGLVDFDYSKASRGKEAYGPEGYGAVEYQRVGVVDEQGEGRFELKYVGVHQGFFALAYVRWVGGYYIERRSLEALRNLQHILLYERRTILQGGGLGGAGTRSRPWLREREGPGFRREG